MKRIFRRGVNHLILGQFVAGHGFDSANKLFFVRSRFIKAINFFSRRRLDAEKGKHPALENKFDFKLLLAASWPCASARLLSVCLGQVYLSSGISRDIIKFTWRSKAKPYYVPEIFSPEFSGIFNLQNKTWLPRKRHGLDSAGVCRIIKE